MKRVLVTRPAPLAERTARRLAAMGYEAVVLPLTETRPLEVDPARISTRGGAAGQLPPPLTPPHKGEGDEAVAGSAKIHERSGAGHDAAGSPPPCGEGQGWGSETRPIPPKDSHAIAPGGAGLVAVTSANAILHAPGDLVRDLAGLPCLAVGGATASAARAAGFRSVREGPGDAAGLARLLLSLGRTGPVVYLCGRVRRPDFERALGAAGLEVTAVETYDTVGIRLDDGQAAAGIGGGVLDAALVYSAAAAEALDELAGREAFAPLFRDTAFCCLSQRIAAGLGAGSARKILVAPEPTEDALLSLLTQPGGRLDQPPSFLAPLV